MKTVKGDIWTVATKDDAIVVTTNVGWRKDGTGILGAGLARQAARRFLWLSKHWGQYCQQEGVNTGPVAWRVDSKWCRYLIPFPTKALNEAEPWLSWRADSSLELIERCLEQLAGLAPALCAYATQKNEKKPLILVPSLGCQNGNLDEKVVVPVMAKYLTHPAFVHVRYGA